VGTDRALGFMDQMLWTAMAIGGPVLLATLVVGLLISILQVATQVQEITLSYVPKMLVAVFVLIALGPWMLAQLTEFARSLYLLIPSLAH